MDNNAPNMLTPEMERILQTAPNIVCTGEGCGNATFNEVIIFKHVSAILSPNGKAGAVPIPTFACNRCGHVNDIFLPNFLRQILKPEPSTSEDLVKSSPTSTSTPKLEIIR